MECRGNAEDHCCNLGRHGVCGFLDHDGERWRCRLRTELGSWEVVHLDGRYLEQVKPKLLDINLDVDCGDWPRPGERCATCGGGG